MKLVKKKLNQRLIFFNINILSLMLGFFFSNILSTIPAQTGDWNIVSGAIIVTFNEVLSKIIYRQQKLKKINAISLINNIKVGIIYGLFVDAFKLGS
uniref:Uncharacterized protein ycf20 n=1 Tax=Ophidocladus simpliciusculus TaxID=1261574 RepID=A0A1Z1MJ97_9FLOR|nr:hypothetical protein [Ophidocladus simpliciusculus]ARW65959.1 hypothetical protein [Ophidocladus simpliciusculus]